MKRGFFSPKIWLAHSSHENDQVCFENVIEYFEEIGVRHDTIELTLSGPQAALQRCIDDKPTAVLAFNSQLDHSWLPHGNFVAVAAANGIPVIHWVCDHPALRWAEFHSSTSYNSSFLVQSLHSAEYFHRHCLPGSLVGIVGGIGPNRRSRVADLTFESFLARSIPCLLPLNLSRGAETHVDTRIDALGEPLTSIVREAIASAFTDLKSPLDRHLSAVLDAHNQTIGPAGFNRCFSLFDESIHLQRRQKILRVAANYPVLIQSDKSAHAVLPRGSQAKIATDVGMRATCERMQISRAVLSTSNVSDLIHDRVANGLNAGCVVIAEDNIAHGAILEHGKSALLFRYDDDSLDECFDIVCNQPRRAYEIAKAGLALRDNPQVRFGPFRSILEIAKKQLTRLRR